MTLEYNQYMDTQTRLKYKGNEKYYEDRNRDLIKDRKSGMSWRSLQKKYDLSDTRLRVIVERHSNKF
jgi:Mor family transcriptional regulator